MAETYHNFRFSESNIFFRPGLEIPISLNPLTKLAFWRRRFGAVEDRASEVIQCELIKLICPAGGKSACRICGAKSSRPLSAQLIRQGRRLRNFPGSARARPA